MSWKRWFERRVELRGTIKGYRMDVQGMDTDALHAMLTANNEAYAAAFDSEGVPGQAGTSLLLLTCMDSRIVPHEALGLKVGDVKVIRNAGGQVNPEVLNDIVLASHLLNCQNIVIMPHTRCAMASLSLGDVRTKLSDLSGMDFTDFSPRMIEDAHAKLAADVSAVKAHPLLKPGVKVRGAVYDVDTGRIMWH